MNVKKTIYGLSTLAMMLPMTSMAAVNTSCGTADNGTPAYTCSGSSWGCNRFYKTVLVLGGQSAETSLTYLGDLATSDAVIEINGKTFELTKYDVHLKQHEGRQYVVVMDGEKKLLREDIKWSDVYISGNHIREGRTSYQKFLDTAEGVKVDVLSILDSKK